MSAMTLNAADIHAAAQRLRGHVLDTPCVPSRTLSAITGCEVFLKFENLQFTASFKERGALNKIAQLSDDERARGVLAVSAGNHAQGVAYHAQRLGIPATIVMPRFAPAVKVENTRRFGATVVLGGDTFDDALLVGDDDIEQAILMLLEIEKTVVEGAGAVGLAALMKHRGVFAGRKVGLVLSGGNIEPLVLAEIIERGMVKSGRLARLRFDVRDVPGALADVAALLGKLGANIDEVQHQRAFTSLSVERAQIEVVVHTRGVAPIKEILIRIRAHGYR